MVETPDILGKFALDETFRDIILESMKEQGWTPSNPRVTGMQLNTLFFQIYSYLNFQKEHGFSYYDEKDTHKVGHLKRSSNKIYFCKKDNDSNNKQNPLDNDEYWDIFFDLDNPIYKELLKYSKIDHNHDTTYAKIGGLATQLFKVKAAVAGDEAVNKLQMENALSNLDLSGFLTFSDLKEIGVSQTWQNVTADRDPNVTYTNTTGKPIMVSARISTNEDRGYVSISVDGITTNGDQRDNFGSSYSVYALSIVPAGSSYIIRSQMSFLTEVNELK